MILRSAVWPLALAGYSAVRERLARAPCREVPIMDSAQSFVMIDRNGSGFRLWKSLGQTGAKVHVFNTYAGALMLLQHKTVDAVMVEFSNDKPTADFCNAVRRLKIPIVFSPAPPVPHDVRQFGFEIGFARRSESPTIFVPYHRRRGARGSATFRAANKA